MGSGGCDSGFGVQRLIGVIGSAALDDAPYATVDGRRAVHDGIDGEITA